MDNVLMTYSGVGIFALAGLVFAILVKPDNNHKRKIHE